MSYQFLVWGYADYVYLHILTQNVSQVDSCGTFLIPKGIRPNTIQFHVCATESVWKHVVGSLCSTFLRWLEEGNDSWTWGRYFISESLTSDLTQWFEDLLTSWIVNREHVGKTIKTKNYFGKTFTVSWTVAHNFQTQKQFSCVTWKRRSSLACVVEIRIFVSNKIGGGFILLQNPDIVVAIYQSGQLKKYWSGVRSIHLRTYAALTPV